MSIYQATIKYLKINKIEENNLDVPKRITLYSSLGLLSPNAFSSDEWKPIISKEFYSFLAKELSLTHLARLAPIDKLDPVRKPSSLIGLYGDFGLIPDNKFINNESIDINELINNPTSEQFDKAYWAITKQNGIYQVWAPFYSMFSRGNIKEKARILNTFTDIKEKIVIDLYAGIGYFTFSYMKCNAKYLLCWEINPWSVEGLKRGAKINKWTVIIVNHKETTPNIFKFDRAIFVFLESNQYATERVNDICLYANNSNEINNINLNVSHINLGLLPSSQDSWPIAASCIDLINNKKQNKFTSYVHVHGNVSLQDLNEWENEVKLSFENLFKNIFEKNKNDQIKNITTYDVSILHSEKIKTFAPSVWHICTDVCINIKN